MTSRQKVYHTAEGVHPTMHERVEAQCRLSDKEAPFWLVWWEHTRKAQSLQVHPS
jgi:hypothetical protein